MIKERVENRTTSDPECDTFAACDYDQEKSINRAGFLVRDYSAYASRSAG